jgi:hypothetical protein
MSDEDIPLSPRTIDRDAEMEMFSFEKPKASKKKRSLFGKDYSSLADEKNSMLDEKVK